MFLINTSKLDHIIWQASAGKFKSTHFTRYSSRSSRAEETEIRIISRISVRLQSYLWLNNIKMNANIYVVWQYFLSIKSGVPFLLNTAKSKDKTKTSQERINLVKWMCSKLRTKLHEHHKCCDLLWTSNNRAEHPQPTSKDSTNLIPTDFLFYLGIKLYSFYVSRVETVYWDKKRTPPDNHSLISFTFYQ